MIAFLFNYIYISIHFWGVMKRRANNAGKAARYMKRGALGFLLWTEDRSLRQTNPNHLSAPQKDVALSAGVPAVLMDWFPRQMMKMEKPRGYS